MNQPRALCYIAEGQDIAGLAFSRLQSHGHGRQVQQRFPITQFPVPPNKPLAVEILSFMRKETHASSRNGI